MKFEILNLSMDDLSETTAVARTIFGDNEKYSEMRISNEMSKSIDCMSYTNLLFYKKFFITKVDGEIVGVGGIKAADWASNTHILYLSGVLSNFRNKGIGTALIKERIDWIKRHFIYGRILVSTTHPKRFQELKFKDIDKDKERHLMVYKWK